MSKEDSERIGTHCGDAWASAILESSELSGKYRLLKFKRAIVFSTRIVAR